MSKEKPLLSKDSQSSSHSKHQENEISMSLLSNDSHSDATTLDGSPSSRSSSSIVTRSKLNQSNPAHKVITIDDLQARQSFDENSASKNSTIIKKEIKIEYYERDTVKKVMGPGGQKVAAKPKFEWKLYRKLLDYVMREKTLVVIIYSSLLISNLSQTFIPYIIGQLLNDVTQENGTSVTGTSLQFLFLIIITCVFGFIRGASSNLLGQKVMNSLKSDIFSQFVRNDIAFFEKHKTGDLMSRLSRDVATAKSAISFNTTMLLRNALLCFSNIVMLFVISWKVTLAIVPIFPIYYFVTKKFTVTTKEIEKKTSDISAVASELAEEVFSGISTVKSFAQEDFETKKYATILNDEYVLNRKAGYLNAFFFMINNSLLSNLGILIVLWYGGYIVTTQSGELTSGDLASFILYSTSLATNSSAISYGLGSIVSSMGALDRIFEMMQYVPAVDEKSGQEVSIISGSIQLKNVTFHYPSTKNVQILHGIDVEISPGECVAFVGTSGSGKSTIIKLIERFYDASSGQVCIDNHDVKSIKSSSLRKQIGLVSQEPILFSGTILDNIVYGIDSYSMEDVDNACRMSGVDEFMKDASIFPKGYATVVGERGMKLSGGQKQRVAIARALIKKPSILIFDEATSALDAESEYLVQTSIDGLIANRTITIIVIAHRLSTIKKCSLIHVMQSGKIVESGTHNDLIAREGPYKQLVERQLSQAV